MAWETTYTCFPWPCLQYTNSRHLKVDFTRTVNVEKLPEVLEWNFICYKISNQLDCSCDWKNWLLQFFTTVRIHNGLVSVQRFWGLKVCIGKQNNVERDCLASYAENDSALRNLFVTHCRKKWWLRFWLPCFISSRSLLKAQIKRTFLYCEILFCCIMRCFLVSWFLINSSMGTSKSCDISVKRELL